MTLVPPKSRAARTTWIGMLAIVALLLSGCTPAEAPSTPDPALQGNWRLISATDAKGALSLADTYVSLRIRASNSTNGIGPCGAYQAAVTGQTGVVFVGVTVPTTTFCTDETTGAVNRRYLTALRSADHARVLQTSVIGPVLTLTSGSTTLRYARERVTSLAGMIGATWRLRQFPAQAPAIAGLDLRLNSINLRILDPGRLTVSSPCAKLEIDFIASSGASLAPGGWSFTKLDSSSACTGDIRGLTTALRKLLTSTTLRLTRIGNNLVVYSDQSGGTAVFTSEPQL